MDAIANGRGVFAAGIVGLALGVYLGNSMKKGSVTRQVRSTGRTIFRRARSTVGNRLDNWIG
ncbi:MAG TPA: hypothetical protein GX521_08380 [Firmicutes bacterium]|nr:hypothetical protein [Bacillota bacterium]